MNFIRYFYTALGGFLVGTAGAAYTLAVKIGWSEGAYARNGMDSPGDCNLRKLVTDQEGLLGLFYLAQQRHWQLSCSATYPEVSVVAFNSIPWILMILVLLTVNSDYVEELILRLPKKWQRPVRKLVRASPPLALGSDFDQGKK